MIKSTNTLLSAQNGIIEQQVFILKLPFLEVQ